MISLRLAGLISLALTIASANAQFASRISMKKKQHLVGEDVIATLTITNHTGQDQTFHNDGRIPWLNFIVKTNNGEAVNAKAGVSYGSMKIAPGETLSREIDLSKHFHLTRAGNFSVVAVIRPPGSNLDGSSTNRAFFNMSPGRVYWSQKVGVMALKTTSSGAERRTRQYKLLNFSGDNKPYLYAQVEDVNTGQNLATYSLGQVLMMRKPVATVDKQQRMHVLFLATPSMYLHYIIKPDGSVANRQIHKRGSIGDPKLLTMPDGTVEVTNSIPYDPVEAAKKRAKIHRISDRPDFPY